MTNDAFEVFVLFILQTNVKTMEDLKHATKNRHAGPSVHLGGGARTWLLILLYFLVGLEGTHHLVPRDDVFCDKVNEQIIKTSNLPQIFTGCSWLYGNYAF